MNYCKRCIIPDTRPDQYLNNDGVCNACLSFDLQNKVDWNQRKLDFLKIINEKNLDKNKWNCVVPGSGGKDSTYQIIRARELGLNPVFVTASTCDLSEIGRQNLENVKKIGFVSEKNLDITLQDKTLCNLRVDELTEKFNNSISSYV